MTSDKFDYNFNIDGMLEDLARIKTQQSNDHKHCEPHYYIDQDSYANVQGLLNPYCENEVYGFQDPSVTCYTNETCSLNTSSTNGQHRQLKKKMKTRCRPARDTNTGQTKPSIYPPSLVLWGEKLGLNAEEAIVEFRKLYMQEFYPTDLSNADFAKIFGVQRKVIFNSQKRKNGKIARCWLNYPSLCDLPRRIEVQPKILNDDQLLCPICAADMEGSVHKSHWYSKYLGGNLTMETCANCNQKMIKHNVIVCKKYAMTLLNNKQDWTEEEFNDFINGCVEHGIYLTERKV